MEFDREMFEARQTMDAMTTNSGNRDRDSGSEGARRGGAGTPSGTGAGQEDQGGWGWFSKPRPAAEEPAPAEPPADIAPRYHAAPEPERAPRPPEQNRRAGSAGWDDWFTTATPPSGTPGTDAPGAGQYPAGGSVDDARPETVPPQRMPYRAPARQEETREAAPGRPEGAWFGGEGPGGGGLRSGPVDAPGPRWMPEAADGLTGATEYRPRADASADAVLIRRTMEIIEPVGDKTTSYFYALVFLNHPELRELFPAAMDVQRDRLFRALLTASKLVDDPGTLTAFLTKLGRGHRKYGTMPVHYPPLGECLLGALSRYASEIWNDEVEAAWVRAYTAISQIMIDAAAEDEQLAPAWWHAEIVSHELRTSDIAVVTVRPDQPYPFLAGQYASVETPWWPRVWRHYSFAAAPRSDGLLTFHVKAVPAGWVSSAIVNRARPGDVIRLGAPAGSMTVDHGSDNGLLCLGGGTGIAPIKAMVEDVVEHGRRRPVDVFYAARNDHDLYDLETMRQLEARHSWLSIRPVVSGGPVSGGGLVSGQLPEIVTRFGPWPAYDAYLSGPPGMIRSSVDALVGIGMPSNRIRHDSLEELASARD